MQTTIRNLRHENNYYYDRLDRISKQLHNKKLLKEKNLCTPIQKSLFNMPSKTTSNARSKLMETGLISNGKSREKFRTEVGSDIEEFKYNDNTSRIEKLSSKAKDNLAKTSEFTSRAKIGLANDSLQPFAHTTGIYFPNIIYFIFTKFLK